MMKFVLSFVATFVVQAAPVDPMLSMANMGIDSLKIDPEGKKMLKNALKVGFGFKDAVQSGDCPALKKIGKDMLRMAEQSMEESFRLLSTIDGLDPQVMEFAKMGKKVILPQVHSMGYQIIDENICQLIGQGAGEAQGHEEF